MLNVSKIQKRSSDFWISKPEYTELLGSQWQDGPRTISNTPIFNIQGRPSLIWASGISRYSLIRSRRQSLAYFDLFYTYQSRITKFFKTLYRLSLVDLVMFTQFNIKYVLLLSSLCRSVAEATMFINFNYVFCNFLTIRSPSFICNWSDHISLSPMVFVTPNYHLSVSDLYGKYSYLSRASSTVFEFDLTVLSLIILAGGLTSSYYTRSSLQLIKLPTLNYRSLNWKYLS